MRQASAPSRAACASGPGARHKMGSSVAARTGSTAPRTTSASAPCASAARAEAASCTSTRTEIPSPSEIAWLKRRAAIGRVVKLSAALLPDRVPDGLELEKGGDLPRALNVRASMHDPLNVLCGGALELGKIPVGCREVDRIYVHVSGQPGRELGAAAGQQVQGTARDVGGCDRLRELDGGE